MGKEKIESGCRDEEEEEWKWERFRVNGECNVPDETQGPVDPHEILECTSGKEKDAYDTYLIFESMILFLLS